MQKPLHYILPRILVGGILNNSIIKGGVSSCIFSDSEDMMKKPRLSLGQNTEEEQSSPSRPRLGVKSDDRNTVTSTKSTGTAIAESTGRLLKGILVLVAFGVILLGVLYSGLSATLMFTAPSEGDQTNRVWVARSAFPGGIVPEGSYVYGASNKAADNSILTKISEGFTGTDKYFVAKTISGPDGKVSVDGNGNIVVNGTATEYKGDFKERTLDKEYLSVCTEGSCKKGEAIFVPEGNLVGEAKGFVNITDFSFSSYKDGIGNEPSDAK
jgi:hypothetical protein